MQVTRGRNIVHHARPPQVPKRPPRGGREGRGGQAGEGSGGAGLGDLGDLGELVRLRTVPADARPVRLMGSQLQASRRQSCSLSCSVQAGAVKADLGASPSPSRSPSPSPSTSPSTAPSNINPTSIPPNPRRLVLRPVLISITRPVSSDLMAVRHHHWIHLSQSRCHRMNVSLMHPDAQPHLPALANPSCCMTSSILLAPQSASRPAGSSGTGACWCSCSRCGSGSSLIASARHALICCSAVPPNSAITAFHSPLASVSAQPLLTDLASDESLMLLKPSPSYSPSLSEPPLGIGGPWPGGCKAQGFTHKFPIRPKSR